MNKPTRIFIVEENSLVGETLQRILKEEPGFKICGMSSVPPASSEIKKARTDLLIIDLVSTGSGLLSGCRSIRAALPELRILAMSSQNVALDWVNDAKNAGAQGFVFNSSPSDDILKAVRTVADGRALFFGNSEEIKRAWDRHRDQLALLTKMEHNIYDLHYIVGLTQKQIAQQLDRSVYTIQTHIKSLKLKLASLGASLLKARKKSRRSD